MDAKCLGSHFPVIRFKKCAGVRDTSAQDGNFRTLRQCDFHQNYLKIIVFLSFLLKPGDNLVIDFTRKRCHCTPTLSRQRHNAYRRRTSLCPGPWGWSATLWWLLSVGAKLQNAPEKMVLGVLFWRIRYLIFHSNKDDDYFSEELPWYASQRNIF